MSSICEKILTGLSLRDRVAQLIVPKIEGVPRDNDGEYEKLLSQAGEFSFGGYIVFRGSADATPCRISAISGRSSVPPLFMADLERGPGQQIEGLPNFPHAMAFSATGDTDLAYLAGELTAKYARKVGIPVVLAPVIDVQTNPRNPIIGIRAYSDSPGMVAEFAYRFAHGLKLGGALPTLKHFPGHGDTGSDSHAELPVVKPSRERLFEVELLPYRRILRHFPNAVMVGHIAVDSLSEEPGIPATCSSIIVGEMLNRTLDFNGLVITDAILMDGFTSRLGLEEALKRSVLAGCDLLLYPSDPVSAMNMIVGMVQNGVIPEGRIDHSVRKILAWKEDMGLLGENGFLQDDLNMETVPGDLGRTVLERAVTLMRDDGQAVPLPEVSRLMVAVIDDDGLPDAESPAAGAAFADMLHRAAGADAVYFGPSMQAGEAESLLGIAGSYPVGVISVFSRPRAWKGNHILSERSASVLKELCGRFEKAVVVIFGTPYIFELCDGADAVLCMYDTSRTAEEVAADSLLGRIPITGRLPVSISDDLPRGSGIARCLTRK